MVIENKEFKINKKDVGMLEDMSFAIRNLVAWEDHLSRHIAKVDKKEKDKYQSMLNRVRERRSLLLDFIVSDEIYAEWCMSKHGFSCSMAFIELGNRFSSVGDTKKANRCFRESLSCEDDVFEINGINRKEGEVNSEA